ncbi:carbohydrate sulfotransferase 15-like [Mercenaria mercenaria]|uniref:carbohydrate sulfotransferase 15-like n=1 Tax=Mercenaria mercenaria TaxID=6596 RepID=UPI00234EFADB|nr:carbohydrate sulfotransferase 15-like [Mercenaria mercenaria]
MHDKSNIHKKYQLTQKTSKPESSEKQAVYVDTDYGKDLVREEGFTVNSSCIRRVTGVEDILCMNRPQFLPDFRNPCWYQRGSLKCLPYFHIIGVCKTGTTDLFERLCHHPQILENNGIFGKETQYWTWRRYGHRRFYMEITDHKTLDNFIDQFDASAIERYTKRMPNGSLYHPVVTGHGDPMDFWDQSSWKQIPQNDPTTDTPEVTTPTLIKHVNPNVKLILIFRDPIERLFSSYLHGGFGTTAAEFHEDVLMSQSLLTSCARDRSMKACLYDEGIIRNLWVPISGSFYSVHLQEWLKVFPRKQIFILRTEEYSQNIADSLLRIFRFLHLDPLPTRDLYRIANMPRFFNTKAKETFGEIQDETKLILRSLFEPYNNELAAILNDQKYNFNNI